MKTVTFECANDSKLILKTLSKLEVGNVIIAEAEDIVDEFVIEEPVKKGKK